MYHLLMVSIISSAVSVFLEMSGNVSDLEHLVCTQMPRGQVAVNHFLPPA